MTVKILISLLALTTVLGCSKDKYQTRPQIKVKSISTTTVPLNGSLTMVLEFTDAEGDIQDSIYIRKTLVNPASGVIPVRASMFVMPPEVPRQNNLKGDISITFTRAQIGISNPSPRNDTVIYSFVLKDKAKNVSDTVSTERIAILRN